MKTKDLIALLEKTDPTGELECNVNGSDIYFAERLPGYYDGYYEVLIHDPAKKPYYSVAGAKLTTEGEKVRIRTLSAKDALETDPKMPIEVAHHNPTTKAKLESMVAKWRKEEIDIKNEMESEHFAEYIEETHKVHQPLSYIFYNQHMSWDDPLPKDILKGGGSWNDRRKMYYERTFTAIDDKPAFKEKKDVEERL